MSSDEKKTSEELEKLKSLGNTEKTGEYERQANPLKKRPKQKDPTKEFEKDIQQATSNLKPSKEPMPVMITEEGVLMRLGKEEHILKEVQEKLKLLKEEKAELEIAVKYYEDQIKLANKEALRELDATTKKLRIVEETIRVTSRMGEDAEEKIKKLTEELAILTPAPISEEIESERLAKDKKEEKSEKSLAFRLKSAKEKSEKLQKNIETEGKSNKQQVTGYEKSKEESAHQLLEKVKEEKVTEKLEVKNITMTNETWNKVVDSLKKEDLGTMMSSDKCVLLGEKSIMVNRKDDGVDVTTKKNPPDEAGLMKALKASLKALDSKTGELEESVSPQSTARFIKEAVKEPYPIRLIIAPKLLEDLKNSKDKECVEALEIYNKLNNEPEKTKPRV